MELSLLTEFPEIFWKSFYSNALNFVFMAEELSLDEMIALGNKGSCWIDRYSGGSYFFTRKVGDLSVSIGQVYGNTRPYVISIVLGSKTLGSTSNTENGPVKDFFLNLYRQHKEQYEKLNSETREDALKYARSLVENDRRA